MAYSKKTWVDDEVITKEALNNIETGIENTEKAIPSTATKTKAGTVKQAAMVAGAAGENVTQAEFKALLDSLKTSGIMASS
mgnify:FL=1|jgi:hypothetical protein